MISPARIKKGIASRLNDFTPCTMRCVIAIIGRSRYHAVTIEDTASVNVIGTRRTSRTKNVANRIVEAVEMSGIERLLTEIGFLRSRIGIVTEKIGGRFIDNQHRRKRKNQVQHRRR